MGILFHKGRIFILFVVVRALMWGENLSSCGGGGGCGDSRVSVCVGSVYTCWLFGQLITEVSVPAYWEPMVVFPHCTRLVVLNKHNGPANENNTF